MPFDGRDEGVEIQIESVLHGGIVDFRDQPTRSHQRCGVDTGHLGHLEQFMRRAA